MGIMKGEGQKCQKLPNHNCHRSINKCNIVPVNAPVNDLGVQDIPYVCIRKVFGSEKYTKS